jgi:adenylate cyclase
MAGGTQRRLAAIVSADVAGYSRLMGADEDGTLEALKAHRRELVDPKVAEHRGRIVKTTGDGILLEFASVVDAVRCCVEVQHAMAERNAGTPEDRRMLFRVGINLGDIIIDGDDIHGDGVNVAARLEALSEPGSIAISGNVHEQVQGKIDVQFIDDGAHGVKNIAKPVRVWRWSPMQTSTTSAVGVVSDGALPLPDKPSIAVLPFENMSGDAEQEYFADGMTEDIITDLSRFENLFVIARNTSFTYKGKRVDVKDVARELGVRFILEGSVRKAGTRVRITAQLIDGQDGGHLWAERYDGALEDVFDLQEQVTRQVVGG